MRRLELAIEKGIYSGGGVSFILAFQVFVTEFQWAMRYALLIAVKGIDCGLSIECVADCALFRWAGLTYKL